MKSHPTRVFQSLDRVIELLPGERDLVVLIHRPHFWGNPFSSKMSAVPGTTLVSSQEDAVSRHMQWLADRPELVKRCRAELAGKVLVCLCKTGPCHGHTLARVADGGPIIPPAHICHARGCSIAVEPAKFMCRSHWGLVPAQLQRLVWRHYRPGQEIDKDPSEGYLNVADAAIAAVATSEGRRISPAERKALDAYVRGDLR